MPQAVCGFSLIQRAQRICTKLEDLDSDLACIQCELSTCKCPRSFITVSEKLVLHPTEPSDALSQCCTAILYVPGISEALACVLCRFNVQVAHVPSHKLHHRLVNVKGKIRKERFPGILYNYCVWTAIMSTSGNATILSGTLRNTRAT